VAIYRRIFDSHQENAPREMHARVIHPAGEATSIRTMNAVEHHFFICTSVGAPEAEALIDTDVPLCEPMWFCLGFAQRVDGSTAAEPVNHPNGCHSLTALQLTLPVAQSLSRTTQLMQAAGIVSIVQGTEPVLEAVFDNSEQGSITDFRPGLPLLIRC